MAEVGKLNVEITADIKDLQKKLKQSQTMVKTAAKQIGTLSIKMDISSLEKSGKKATITFKDVASGASNLLTTTAGLIKSWQTVSGVLTPVIEKQKQRFKLLINESVAEASGATVKKTLLLLQSQMGLAAAKGNLLLAKGNALLGSKIPLLSVEAATQKVSTAASAVDAKTKDLQTASTWGLVIAENALLVPILAFIAIAAAVVGAILLFTKKNREAKKANDEFTDSLEESKQAFEDNQKEANVSAEVTKSMADELIDLNNKASLTSEEMARMSTLVSALNESFPDLNLEIDAQTGKLKGNTEALKENIESLLTMLEVQAAQERIVEIYKEQYKIEQQIKAVRHDESIGDKTRKDIIKDLKKQESYLNDELEDRLDFIADNIGLTDAYSQAQEEADKKTAQAAEEAAQRKKNSLIDVNELWEEIYAEQEMSEEDHWAAIADIQNSSYEDAEEQIKEHLQEIADMREESYQEVEDAKQRHLDNLNNISLSEKTAEESLAEINNNTDLYNEYNEGLRTLSTLKGVTPEIMVYFEDEGADNLQALRDVIANPEMWLPKYVSALEDKNAALELGYSTEQYIDNYLESEKAAEEADREKRAREMTAIAGAQEVANVFSGAEGGINASSESISGAFAGISANAQEVKIGVESTIDEMGITLPEKFSSIGGAIFDIVGMIFGGIPEKVTESKESVGTAAGEVGDEITEGVSVSEEEAQTAIGGLPSFLAGILFGSKETIGTAAGEVGDEITGGVSVSEEEAQTAIGGLPGFLAGILSGSKETVGTAAGEMANSIPEEVSTAQETLEIAFNTIGDLLQEKIHAISKNIKIATVEMTNEIILTISESMKKKVTEIFADIIQVGAMFINGLTIGLELNQYKAFSKAQYIASRVVSIIRSAWDENSPSKKAIGLSTNFIKGLAIGMGKGDALIEMSSGLARGMTEQMNSTFNSYANTTSTLYQNTYNTTYQAATSNNDDANMADFENRIRRAYA